ILEIRLGAPRTWDDRHCALPGLVRLPGVIRFLKLIALAITNTDYTQRHERRRNDEDQDSALQRLNHARTRGGSLRIAQCATLGKSRQRHYEYNCNQHPKADPTRSMTDADH